MSKFVVYMSPQKNNYKIMVKKNIAMMRDEMPSIMDLEFFSKRFNIRKELMSWGLQRVTAEERTSYVPVVIIKGSQVYIDIRRDSFSSRLSTYGRTAELLQAIMEENSQAYVFSSDDEDARYVFKKDDLRALYEKKLMF